MANPPPFDIFPPVPPGPYNFNDTRICYNEPCFEYNGGFDLVCLFGVVVPPRKRGKSTTQVGRQYPEPQMVDLLFKTCITCINEDEFEEGEFCEERKYTFKKESDIQVTASELHVNIKEKTVSAKLGKVSTAEDSEHISASHNVVKLENKTEFSSSLRKLKTYVSSSLHLNTPRKIVIKSSSIKVKKKD